LTQYVTITFGGKSRGYYTYEHSGKKVWAGDTVIIDARDSGIRPAMVVDASENPPDKKNPAPDGFIGKVVSRTVR